MANITKITLPSGTTYDLQDSRVDSLVTSALKYVGVTTTALTDGATTATITIDGASHTAASGDVAIYGSCEFIFNGSKWNEFGSTGSLKALAFKDSASGSGTVSVPSTVAVESTSIKVDIPTSVTLTVEDADGSLSPAIEGDFLFTPVATASGGSVSVTPSTVTKYVASSATGGGVTNTPTAVTLPTLSFTWDESTTLITVSWSGGSVTAGKAATMPSFSSQKIATGISSTTMTQPTITCHPIEFGATLMNSSSTYSVAKAGTYNLGGATSKTVSVTVS